MYAQGKRPKLVPTNPVAAAASKRTTYSGALLAVRNAAPLPPDPPKEGSGPGKPAPTVVKPSAPVVLREMTREYVVTTLTRFNAAADMAWAPNEKGFSRFIVRKCALMLRVRQWMDDVKFCNYEVESFMKQHPYTWQLHASGEIPQKYFKDEPDGVDEMEEQFLRQCQGDMGLTGPEQYDELMMRANQSKRGRFLRYELFYAREHGISIEEATATVRAQNEARMAEVMVILERERIYLLGLSKDERVRVQRDRYNTWLENRTVKIKRCMVSNGMDISYFRGITTETFEDMEGGNYTWNIDAEYKIPLEDVYPVSSISPELQAFFKRDDLVYLEWTLGSDNPKYMNDESKMCQPAFHIRRLVGPARPPVHPDTDLFQFERYDDPEDQLQQYPMYYWGCDISLEG